MEPEGLLSSSIWGSLGEHYEEYCLLESDNV
jgi:hypothetical protein